jgi:hypothetical protein
MATRADTSSHLPFGTGLEGACNPPGRQPDKPSTSPGIHSASVSVLLLTLNNVMMAVARRHLESSKVSSFLSAKRLACF